MKKVVIGILIFIFFPFNVFAMDIVSKSAIVVNRNNGDILFEKEKNLLI